jgi:hypothetical protein
MGAWGAKLYENDTALDVKDRFDDLRKGKSTKEIIEQLIEEYSSVMDDENEISIFWFALADTLWDLGRLTPEVKSHALAWLDKGGDLARWQEENQKLARIREKTFEELRHKLNSPQPPEKKIRKNRLYQCEWNIGDVFAYKLESDLAREKGLFGRHFLIQKVDEGTWYPGHVVPIVYVKITNDEHLPTTAEEYDRLEYVQIKFLKYEERFFPIDGRRPEEDIEEKSKMTYEVDDYGYLPEFRSRIITTSRKAIPSKLVYIGNYSNIAPPNKEFIPHSKINIRDILWKNFDRTFESELINCYLGHNLRQLTVYQSKK